MRGRSPKATGNKAKEFLRAARHRFDAAEYLHQAHSVDAIYIVGYTIECSLKAVLLKNTPQAKLTEVYEAIMRGAKAHDFESLKARLEKAKVSIPMSVVSALRLALRVWSTDLRYETGRRPTEEVEAMFQAAKVVLDWADRSMT